MQYIAALDYEHLDNGVFLTSLARSLSQQQENEDIHPIFIHTDSEYTERIMQTGVMRNEATVRSVKDLNKRLVALFADQGVSTIGINPCQRNFITLSEGELQIDHSFLSSLPDRPVLLLSPLVQNLDNDKEVVIELPRLLQFLFEELTADQLFIFSKSDESEVFTVKPDQQDLRWDTLDNDFKNKQIPDEFIDLRLPVHLTSARDFNQLPNLDHSIFIDRPNNAEK
ncbi:MAG: hypothetical protein U5J63_03015 [Fodinibius sp.]|nr:hypothetical protein [Fodinibius sp.]